MFVYEVWTEGYSVMEARSSAIFHGLFDGVDFRDAVRRFSLALDENSRKYINFDKLTFWGCRFFDNEQDARKAFG